MKKIILLLCIVLSSLALSSEFDGIWKAKDEKNDYFCKIEGNDLILLVKPTDELLEGIKEKGKIKEINGEKFISFTHSFETFDWEKISGETKLIVKLNEGKLNIGKLNLEFEKTDLEFVIGRELDQNKEFKKSINEASKIIKNSNKITRETDNLLIVLKILTVLLFLNIAYSFYAKRKKLKTLGQK